MSLAAAIYTVLTSVNVPKDQVREIVDTIENEMKNEFATKSDIALIRADLALVVSRVDKHEELSKVEFNSVRTEMRTEFAAVRTEMRNEFAAVRTEMRTEIAALRNEMSTEFAAVRNEMRIDSAALRTEMSTEFAAVRNEMRIESAALRTEIAGTTAVLRAEMKDLENRMIIKLGALMVILVGVLPKVLSWLGW